MKSTSVSLCWLLSVTASVLIPAAHAAEPAGEILGLNLSMTEELARERLQKIGTREREEEGWQEIWKIKDDNFSHVIVGFGKDEKLNYITAVAREDKGAKRVPYSKIGDLKSARQTGNVEIKNFNYQWEVAAAKGRPRTLMVAAGRDPKFLTTWSLKNLENTPAKEEKD